MSESTHDLLVRGTAAAKGNSKEEARFYLEWLLRLPDASPEQQQKAWMLLADISDDPKEKRNCLEQALAFDPSDPAARRELAILNGQLKAEDIIDPDRMPAPLSVAAQSAEARSFVCTNCGGKMAFTPDANALVCTYCGRQQSVISALDHAAALAEQDFTVALATAKGHSTPVATQSLKCQSCGASFVLPARTLSTACPYCASPYVIEQTESRLLIPPEGILPFLVTQDQAQRAVLEWYRLQGFQVRSIKALPGGVYLPVWMFDVGGQVTWSCMVEENENWVPLTGSELIYEKDMPVTASHTLIGELTEEIDGLEPEKIVPYDPRYLVDWPTETYQISLTDASLAVRSRILAKMEPRVQAGITQSFKDLHLSTLHMMIESYKLVLVPMWIARYHYEKKWYNLVVNGQTGTVRGEKPRKGAEKWLTNLLYDR